MSAAARLGSLALAAAALTGCTGTDPTLGVGPSFAGLAPPAPATIAAAAPAAPVATSPVPGGTTIAFAPMTGIAAAPAAALTGRLTARAPSLGIALAAAGDPSARYLVKGYLSAAPETASTIVTYVFDVLDPAGNRLHRIQGLVTTPGAGPDAWATVPPQAMQDIADRTLGELAAFAGGRAG